MLKTSSPYSFVTPGMTMAREVIACELQAGSTARATVGFLPRFFASARDGLASFLSAKFDFYKATHLAVEQDKILDKLAGVNFAKIAPLPVAALEGFQGEYLHYGQHVLAGFTYYRDYTEKDVAAYRKLLGTLLTNKNSRIELRDITQRYQQAAKASEDIDQNIATFFERGSHKANVTVGDVVMSTGDLAAVFKHSQTIIEQVKAIDPKKVQASVKEVNDLAELLVQEIEAGSFTDLAGPQLNNLIEGLMALARQVEFFALTYYRATTYIAAIDRLTEVLKKA